jgi:hypothetical protein
VIIKWCTRALSQTVRQHEILDFGCRHAHRFIRSGLSSVSGTRVRGTDHCARFDVGSCPHGWSSHQGN